MTAVRPSPPRREVAPEPSPEGLRSQPETVRQGYGNMGLGRGALLWLIGIPLPIIILLAIFWGG